MTYKCQNCGQELTEENIRLAEAEVLVKRDQLKLYCPAYDSEHDTCPGYSTFDQSQAAKWALDY